jgi:HAD superfamily hydrolase (TIGR01549 family)
MIDTALLSQLSKRYRLFILTGRTRPEYEPLWAEKLGPFFERVYCRDDLAGLEAKPSPDMAKAIIQDNDLAGGFYVGNSVDDMRCAKDAGLVALGVSKSKDILAQAGAFEVIKDINDIKGAFML